MTFFSKSKFVSRAKTPSCKNISQYSENKKERFYLLYLPQQHHFFKITSNLFQIKIASLCWCQLTSNFLKTHHGCMLTCGVVLQDGVLAERLVPPRDQNILEACRSGVITPKNHWSKQSRAALLLRNIDLDTHRDCKGMTNDGYTPTHHSDCFQHIENGILCASGGSRLSFVKWKQNACVGFSQPRSRFQSGKTRRTGGPDKDTGNSLLWNYQPNIQKLEWNLLALTSLISREYFEKNLCCYNKFTNKP